MVVDWEFIAVLITIIAGLLTISHYFWKINKFLGAKSRAVDARLHALREALKIQAAQMEEIIDYLNCHQIGEDKLHKRKALPTLKESAVEDFDDENTGFN